MAAVDLVAVQKTLDGELSSVAVYGSAEQIVEHAQPQRAADRVDPLDVELGDRRAHDGQAACEHRHALGLERVELEPCRIAGANQALASGGRARPA